MISFFLAPLILSPAQTPQVGPSKIRALFVGVGAYSKEVPNSIRGDLDAQRMAHLFRFQLGVPAQNVKILDQDKDLTKQRILEEVDNWLIGKAGKDEALVFYWSGHGTSIKLQDGQELNALVPADFARTSDGASIVGDSLILSRELAQRFSIAKREKGLKDMLWILDSDHVQCSNVDEGLGLESNVTPPSDEQLAGVQDKDDENFVMITAGNERQTVAQLHFLTGLGGSPEPIGPLAYAFQKLGNRLTTYMSYGDLEFELRTIAMEQREERQPQVEAPPLLREGTLFGGHASSRKASYPIALPVNKRSPFDVGATPISFDTSLPLIPVGQLSGIRPGMRFLISGPNIKAREFRVTRAFAQVSQLSSETPATAKELQSAKAILVDAVGITQFEIYIGDESGLDAESRTLLVAKLAANPFMAVLVEKPKSGKRLLGTKEGFQIVGTDVPFAPSVEVPLTVDGAYDYICHHAKAEFVGSLEPQATALFKVEAEACPLTVLGPPHPTEIFSHSKPPPVLTPKDMFAVRVRVSTNRNVLTSMLGEIALPTHKNLFVHVLAVDALGVIKKACEPIVLPANLIERGSWNYIPIQDTTTKKGLVNFQRAREAPGEVAVFSVAESPLTKAALTLKVVVTDSAEDLCALVGRSSAKPATSDLGRVLAAAGRAEALPLGRGKGKPFQDWGVATLRFVSVSR